MAPKHADLAPAPPVLGSLYGAKIKGIATKPTTDYASPTHCLLHAEVMKPLPRWLLIFPAVASGFIASLALLSPLQKILLGICPRFLRFIEATTDFSQPDYSAVSETCLANWYPMAWLSSLVAVVLLAVLISGAIGYRLAPLYKRISGAFSAILAVTAIAIEFFYPGR